MHGLKTSLSSGLRRGEECQRPVLRKPQLGGQGGSGKSADITVTKARVMPASSSNFFIMVEISSYFLEFEWELFARLSPGSIERDKVLHYFGKQNISDFLVAKRLFEPFFSSRLGGIIR